MDKYQKEKMRFQSIKPEFFDQLKNLNFSNLNVVIKDISLIVLIKIVSNYLEES